jgi:hypothetical protein
MQTCVQDRGVEVVTWEGWLQIDAEERRLGEQQGRPRVKITTVQSMLDIASRSRKRVLEDYKDHGLRADQQC